MLTFYRYRCEIILFKLRQILLIACSLFACSTMGSNDIPYDVFHRFEAAKSLSQGQVSDYSSAYESLQTQMTSFFMAPGVVEVFRKWCSDELDLLKNINKDNYSDNWNQWLSCLMNDVRFKLFNDPVAYLSIQHWENNVRSIRQLIECQKLMGEMSDNSPDDDDDTAVVYDSALNFANTQIIQANIESAYQVECSMFKEIYQEVQSMMSKLYPYLTFENQYKGAELLSSLDQMFSIIIGNMGTYYTVYYQASRKRIDELVALKRSTSCHHYSEIGHDDSVSLEEMIAKTL